MARFIFCFDGVLAFAVIQRMRVIFHDSSISNVLKLRALFGNKLNPPNGENLQIGIKKRIVSFF